MHPFIAFLKAVRVQNLLIITLVMYCLQWLILKPLLLLHDISLPISELDFGLFTFSVILIAAAGNIINDYFDLKIDRYNKPDKIIIGRYLKRRIAMVSHLIMNGIALLVAAYVAHKIGVIELIFVQIIWIASLWFYSTHFKRKFLWGNLIIGFCTGLVPFSIALYELPALVATNQSFLAEYPQAYPYFKQLMFTILYWCLGFGGFAFLVTLAREITKDIIDMDGDAQYGCRTIPVVLGIRKTTFIINIIYCLIIISVFVLQQFFLSDKYSLIYISCVFTPITLWTMYLVQIGKHKSDFVLPSLLNKIATVIGILYSVIVFLILTGRI